MAIFVHIWGKNVSALWKGKPEKLNYVNFRIRFEKRHFQGIDLDEENISSNIWYQHAILYHLDNT